MTALFRYLVPSTDPPSRRRFSFMMGASAIVEALEAERMRLGARFDVSAFHDRVLMTRALPLGVLKAKIDGWIADGGPAYLPIQ